MKSHTKFGKPTWALEGLNQETGDADHAVDFPFSVTWSSVFVPALPPKASDAMVPVSSSHRTPTLVVAPPKEPPPPKEETGLSRKLEPPVSVEQPKPDSNSTVSWEMVVPKMTRPSPKPALSEPAPPPFLTIGDQEDKKNSQRKFTRLAIAVGITVVGIFLLLIVHHWLSGSKQAPATQPATAALKLEIEPKGNGAVNVLWNSKAPALAQAREARLVIMERDQPARTVPLDADQLKAGHLLFNSVTERVVLRLEVVDRSGTITKESALALLPDVGPSTPASTPAEAASNSVSGNHALPGKPVDVKVDPTLEEKLSAQSTRPVIRSFTPPRKISDPGERPAVLLDPPGALPTSSNLPSIRLPESSTRISPPSVKQVLTPNAPAVPLKVGGNLQGARLLKKVTPVYPQMATVSHLQGTVRLTALIAKDGTVKNVQVVTGAPLLAKAAMDAVKQWVYQPTVLNGEAVEVQTQIDVNFNLNQ